MSHRLKKIVKQKLALEDPGLRGCVRRNRWTDEDPWRRVRGNALPALAGEKVTVRTPVGPFSAFVSNGRWLLEFRGGPWNAYWLEDIYLTWSILNECSNLDLSDTIFLFHENQGELTVKNIEVPADLDSQERMREAVRKFRSDPPGRIRKDSARAYRICRYCPVQQECDVADREQGDTDDWGPSYEPA